MYQTTRVLSLSHFSSGKYPSGHNEFTYISQRVSQHVSIIYLVATIFHVHIHVFVFQGFLKHTLIFTALKYIKPVKRSISLYLTKVKYISEQFVYLDCFDIWSQHKQNRLQEEIVKCFLNLQKISPLTQSETHK